MRADFGVVLDACILLPMPLADTLLRLAEAPRLYLPRWTSEIMSEVSRNLIAKLNKTEAQASRRESEMRKAFPEAWIEGYEALTPVMSNHLKDRHVLAAAVYSKSEIIVTYNKKDFPRAALAPWGIELRGPSAFLRELYDLEPGIVGHKIEAQSRQLNLSIEDLLVRLRSNIPGFVEFFSQEIGVDLPCPEAK